MVIECRQGDSEQTETYDLSQDYFRFMFSDAVEPTNNHSEQQIRQCVIDRRRPTACVPVKAHGVKQACVIMNECGR